MKAQLKFNLLIALLLSTFSYNSVLASEYSTKKPLKFENEFRFFMEVALHKGSDSTKNMPLYDRNGDFFYSGVDVAVVGNYNGDAENEVLRDEIEAGGYFRTSFGAEFPVAKNLTFSASLGFLFDEISGSLTDGSEGQGTASFKTTVIDFLGFYNLGRHRFGLGGSFHYNPKFDYRETGDDFRLHAVYRFSNALGASVQYDYRVSENTTIGLRYTDIMYDFEDVTVGDYVGGIGDKFIEPCVAVCEEFIDASSVSGHITYRF